jgi:hypothetical protein
MAGCLCSALKISQLLSCSKASCLQSGLKDYSGFYLFLTLGVSLPVPSVEGGQEKKTKHFRMGFKN